MNSCFAIHHKKNQQDLLHLQKMMTNTQKIQEMQTDVVVVMIEMKEDMIVHRADPENGNMTNTVTRDMETEETMEAEEWKKQGLSQIEGKY